MSQREVAWQAYAPREWNGSHVAAFNAGWDARDADVSALLEAARAYVEVLGQDYSGNEEAAFLAALAAFPTSLERESTDLG